MSILADFYNSDVITDPKYKFSPSGVYYAPPKSEYEDYVEFIRVSWLLIMFAPCYDQQCVQLDLVNSRCHVCYHFLCALPGIRR